MRVVPTMFCVRRPSPADPGAVQISLTVPVNAPTLGELIETLALMMVAVPETIATKEDVPSPAINAGTREEVKGLP